MPTVPFFESRPCMVFQSKAASVIKRLDQTRGQPPGTPPQLALRSAARASQNRKQRILTQLPERMHDIDMYTRTVTHIRDTPNGGSVCHGIQAGEN